MTSRSEDEPKGGDVDHNGGSSVGADGRDHIESPGTDEVNAGEPRTDGDQGREVPDSKGKKEKKKGLKGKVEELEEELGKAEALAAEHYDSWLRARAEYDNLRKRTRREIEQVHLRAGESLVRKLLPGLDNLEKAIEASRESKELKAMEEGLLLIQKGLIEPLKACGVDATDPMGDTFDPSVHEAVMIMQTDQAEPGTVVQVVQKGYLMNGITLRPAKVVVAGTVEGPGAGESSTGDSDAGGGETGGEKAPSGEEV